MPDSNSFTRSQPWVSVCDEEQGSVSWRTLTLGLKPQAKL
jgi:hypothetical protein